VNTVTTSDTKPPKKRMPIGCIALIAILVIGMVLVVVSTIRLNAVVTDYQAQFQGDGWSTLEGKTIEQDMPLTTQTLVFAGDITLHGATVDIAILGGNATLYGHYAGTVHFLGKTLDLAPEAVITGTLSITAARHVAIRGTVEGGIEGHWDRLFGGNAPGTAPEPDP